MLNMLSSRNKDFIIIIIIVPRLSKKSGGTLFLAFRGAWRVVSGAWRMVRGAWRVVMRGAEFLVGILSP